MGAAAVMTVVLAPTAQADPDDPVIPSKQAVLDAQQQVTDTQRSVESIQADLATASTQLEELAEWGVISAAAVGRSFLANPDLIERLTLGAELNEPDGATFYAPGPAGYTDYPTLAEAEQLSA